MMMQDALRGSKRFLDAAKFGEQATRLLIGLMTAFIAHLGRMSASQAAGAIGTQARHRAAVNRFVAKQRWSRDWSVLERLIPLRMNVPRQEDRPPRGLAFLHSKQKIESKSGTKLLTAWVACFRGPSRSGVGCPPLRPRKHGTRRNRTQIRTYGMKCQANF